MDNTTLETLLVTEVLVLEKLLVAEDRQWEGGSKATEGYYLSTAVNLIARRRERVLQMLAETHALSNPKP